MCAGYGALRMSATFPTPYLGLWRAAGLALCVMDCHVVQKIGPPARLIILF
ncbi:hypothetical protein D3C73_244660 [compost metagenome]|jgi:hypothetical protein